MNPAHWERFRDWALLLSLLAVSIVTMLARNEPMVRGLRTEALELTARVEGLFAWAGGFIRALDENNRLRVENIRLSSEVARSREARIENGRLLRFLGLRDSLDLPVRAVRILSKDPQGGRFLIDAGSEDGVAPGMAVIDPRGIIGKVSLAGPHHAEVMTYLHTNFRVPARIQPLDVDGVVRWDGKDPDRLVMDFVVKTEPVHAGLPVVTSGYSDTFMPGYPIGVVDSVALRPGRNELLVSVAPHARLRDAVYAFVVLHRPDPARILTGE